MPITIGGGNYNVGSAYLDEQERAKRLGLAREQLLLQQQDQNQKAQAQSAQMQQASRAHEDSMAQARANVLAGRDQEQYQRGVTQQQLGLENEKLRVERMKVVNADVNSDANRELRAKETQAQQIKREEDALRQRHNAELQRAQVNLNNAVRGNSEAATAKAEQEFADTQERHAEEYTDFVRRYAINNNGVPATSAHSQISPELMGLQRKFQDARTARQDTSGIEREIAAAVPDEGRPGGATRQPNDDGKPMWMQDYDNETFHWSVWSPSKGWRYATQKEVDEQMKTLGLNDATMRKSAMNTGVPDEGPDGAARRSVLANSEPSSSALLVRDRTARRQEGDANKRLGYEKSNAEHDLGRLQQSVNTAMLRIDSGQTPEAIDIARASSRALEQKLYAREYATRVREAELRGEEPPPPTDDADIQYMSDARADVAKSNLAQRREDRTQKLGLALRADAKSTPYAEFKDAVKSAALPPEEAARILSNHPHKQYVDDIKSDLSSIKSAPEKIQYLNAQLSYLTGLIPGAMVTKNGVVTITNPYLRDELTPLIEAKTEDIMNMGNTVDQRFAKRAAARQKDLRAAHIDVEELRRTLKKAIASLVDSGKAE